MLEMLRYDSAYMLYLLLFDIFRVYIVQILQH